MNILQEKCFTKEWLDRQRAAMGRVDPGLLEKSMHALELVGLLTAKNLRGCPSSPETEILRTGIRQLDSHIIGAHFNFNEAKTCAAKAAWLMEALKTNRTNVSFPHYSAEELVELADNPLSGEFSLLNRLRTGSPEAYYYWLKIFSSR